MGKYATCYDEQDCFAKTKLYLCGFCITKCTVLSRTDFGDKPCPFAKPKRDVTNGKIYPYNPAEYAERAEDF